MNPSEVAAHYPVLYHMAEQGSWPSIRRYGLLSTEALVDLYGVEEPTRSAILTTRRPASVRLHHDEYGTAVVRDQIPLREGPLRGCLTDMSFEAWLQALNSRVFFWLDESHLEILLGAKAYKDAAHDVIQVDTAELIARYQEQIRLSPINSGSTIYNARPRGSRTFRPIPEYPFEERKRARGKDAIIELSVNIGVPDITEVALRAERRRVGGIVEEVLWTRR